MELTSLVLMAGFSRRMGRPKQHVELRGKTFLTHIIEKLLNSSQNIKQMYFVGQQNDSFGMDIVKKYKGFWVTNPKPENGPLSSIRLALEKIPESSAILLWPTDHPMIDEKTVKDLIAAWMKEPDLITLPSDGKRRGHPSIFPAWCRRYFYEIDLNEGARGIMRLFPDRINHVLVGDPWITKNINTPEILFEAEG